MVSPMTTHAPRAAHRVSNWSRVRWAVASLALCTTSITAASATSAPGSASQVAKLVAASSKITKLSSAMLAKLPAAELDFNWGNACSTVGECIDGDATSSKVAVLFGDSHALMWLPAINATALAHHVKLELVWLGACTSATLSIYYPPSGDPASCDAWRATTVAAIQKLKPAVVLLAERAYAKSSPSTWFDATQWQAGLETTINDFKSSTTKVGVIEDTPSFPASVTSCIAAYSQAVQKCATPWPTTKRHGNQAAELAAASATGATFITTHKWFCTKSCSPVIGTFFPYVDENHVSNTYSAYLATVMTTQLKPLF